MSNEFDKIYNNVIDESYSTLGFWTKEKFKSKIGPVIQKAIRSKSALAQLDDFFVSKKLCSLEKILKKANVSTLKMEIAGKVCNIEFRYPLNFDLDTANKFLIGDKNNFGIIFNPEFKNVLEQNNLIIDQKDLPENDSDSKNPLFDVSADYGKDFLNLKPEIGIVFNTLEYYKGVQPKRYNNPNFVTKASGEVYFVLNDSPYEIGKISYLFKRTEDMNPPKSVKQILKDTWNHPEQTPDLVALGLLKGAQLFTGDLLKNVIQAEEISINLDKKYFHGNNDPSSITGMVNKSTKIDEKYINDMINSAFNDLINTNNLSNIDFVAKLIDENKSNIKLVSSEGDDLCLIQVIFK